MTIINRFACFSSRARAIYTVSSDYNTTLAVREGLHGRGIASVCGLCDEVEE